MIQETLTLILVLAAFIYAAIKIYKKVKKPLDKCDDCSSSDCGGCELQSLKKQIEENQKQSDKSSTK